MFHLSYRNQNKNCPKLTLHKIKRGCSPLHELKFSTYGERAP